MDRNILRFEIEDPHTCHDGPTPGRFLAKTRHRLRCILMSSAARKWRRPTRGRPCVRTMSAGPRIAQRPVSATAVMESQDS